MSIMLKPRATLVLNSLRLTKPGFGGKRSLNARTIAKKLGEQPGELCTLFTELRRMGLVERTYPNLHEPTYACSWTLTDAGETAAILGSVESAVHS